MTEARVISLMCSIVWACSRRLRAAEQHRNGVDWVFWAEEANGDAR